MTTERVELALDIVTAGDAAPTEMRLFRSGENRSKKGKFLFDQKAAEKVMKEYVDHGADKFIDYRHQALDSATGPDGGKAAGWYGLEVRDGELWAVDVRWTPKAADSIANKEWRYLSPAFLAERETGRIIELINVALTNLPATIGQTPLVAAEADVSANQEIDIMPNAIAIALGMAPDAPDGDVLGRAGTLRSVETELCQLSGRPSAKEALATVLAWKSNSEKLQETAARLTALEAEATKAKVAAAVEHGEQEGKIAPAERTFWLAQSIDSVEAYLAVAAPKRELGKSPVAQRAPSVPAELSARVPSAEHLAQLGMTAEEYVQNETKYITAGLLPPRLEDTDHGCPYCSTKVHAPRRPKPGLALRPRHQGEHDHLPRCRCLQRQRRLRRARLGHDKPD